MTSPIFSREGSVGSHTSLTRGYTEPKRDSLGLCGSHGSGVEILGDRGADNSAVAFWMGDVGSPPGRHRQKHSILTGRKELRLEVRYRGNTLMFNFSRGVTFATVFRKVTADMYAPPSALVAVHCGKWMRFVGGGEEWDNIISGFCNTPEPGNMFEVAGVLVMDIIDSVAAEVVKGGQTPPPSAETGEMVSGESVHLSLMSVVRPEFQCRVVEAHGDVGVPGENDLPTFVRSSEIIGTGAASQVYSGVPLSGGLYGSLPVVAVKRIEVDYHVCASVLERLKTELTCLQMMSHERVVRCYGIALAPDGVYLVMKMAGRVMSDFLQNFVSFPKQLAASYVAQVVEALAYLRSIGVVHNDLKADNVIVGADNGVVLSDFGSAFCVRSVSNTQSMGTIQFMSPEAHLGRDTTFSTDIWSLGALVIEMTASKPPDIDMHKVTETGFSGDALREACLATLPDDCDDDIYDFVSWCVTVDPLERPSPEELLEHAFLANQEAESVTPQTAPSTNGQARQFHANGPLSVARAISANSSGYEYDLSGGGGTGSGLITAESEVATEYADGSCEVNLRSFQHHQSTLSAVRLSNIPNLMPICVHDSVDLKGPETAVMVRGDPFDGVDEHDDGKPLTERQIQEFAMCAALRSHGSLFTEQGDEVVVEETSDVLSTQWAEKGLVSPSAAVSMLGRWGGGEPLAGSRGDGSLPDHCVNNVADSNVIAPLESSGGCTADGYDSDDRWIRDDGAHGAACDVSVLPVGNPTVSLRNARSCSPQSPSMSSESGENRISCTEEKKGQPGDIFGAGPGMSEKDAVEGLSRVERVSRSSKMRVCRSTSPQSSGEPTRPLSSRPALSGGALPFSVQQGRRNSCSVSLTEAREGAAVFIREFEQSLVSRTNRSLEAPTRPYPRSTLMGTSPCERRRMSMGAATSTAQIQLGARRPPSRRSSMSTSSTFVYFNK